MGPTGKTFVPFLMLCYLFSTSCVYKRELVRLEPEAAQTTLKSGDLVRVTTKDRRTFEFRIIEVSKEFIVGEEQRVAPSESSQSNSLNCYGLFIPAFLALSVQSDPSIGHGLHPG